MNRIQQMTSWLQEKNISAAIITSTPSVFHLSKFYCHSHERLLAVAIFPQADPFLICPMMEVEQARNCFDAEIVGYSDTENAWDIFAQTVEKRGVSLHSIAVEKTHFTIERLDQLTTFYPNVQLMNAEEKLNELRMIKSDEEIAMMRRAAELADLGIEIGIKAIAEGVSELDLVAKVEYELKRKGVTAMSFATTILAGKKTAAPHGHPSLDKVKYGDFVLFDLGVVWEGYCSDITRTVVFGEASEEQQKIYEVCLQAQLAGIEASKPNVVASEVDRATRTVIENAGYGEYFTHRTGHGLGIGIHEFPSVHANCTTMLQKGMVYTIEPGIYLPEVGGVRIEDDVLITENGVEVLTKYPKELLIIK